MKEIENITKIFQNLSGVGEKTATRYAYEILEMDKNKIQEMQKALEQVKTIRHCQICNAYTTFEQCTRCQEDRNPEKLIIVLNHRDVEKIEKILPNQYYYYILLNLIDPLNGKNVEDLDLKKLDLKINKDNISEIILILPTSLPGELTAQYLKEIYGKNKIKFTKLAQGIPIGGDLDYLDEITIHQSIEHRQEF